MRLLTVCGVIGLAFAVTWGLAVHEWPRASEDGASAPVSRDAHGAQGSIAPVASAPVPSVAEAANAAASPAASHEALTEVEAESAAANAGIQSGDEILAYAGRRVFSAGELNALMLQTPEGDTVATTVVRNGQTMQLYVTGGMLGISPARR